MTETNMRLSCILCCVLLIGIVACDSGPSFQPNGRTILEGAIVCPDSGGARSEFRKGIQGQEAMKQLGPSGDPANLQAALETMKSYKADFSPYGCSELESGAPVYIESEDAGIATITAKLRDDTLLRGITYASEVQSNGQ